jgi:hypothetical protein
MADLREKRAKEIQSAIGDVLMKHWDPIGVAEVPEAKGEYDSYIGPVYRVLAGSRSEEELVTYLSHIETKMMGFAPPPRAHLQAIASRLLAIDVSF